MKVVILAGGKGLRLHEKTKSIPKPMVMIGNKPMLWHIMQRYAHYGHTEFIICLGYKGNVIRDYFGPPFDSMKDWSIEYDNAGTDAQTGARIRHAMHKVDGTFMCTYGDGLADIDILALERFHHRKRATATMTGVNPISRFGHVHEQNGYVHSFIEKPKLDDEYINAGYYIFEPEVFDCISNKLDCRFEADPLATLANSHKLRMYKHPGFWSCVDTMKDLHDMNQLYRKGNAPWRQF